MDEISQSGDRLRSIGEILSKGIWPDGSRHAIVRSGPREQIPDHVRAAVWWRDRGRCEHCGTVEWAKPWEIDHITPWSAGGTHDSSNLRVLCRRHNQDRGNAVDPTERHRRRVTWWCLNCFTDKQEWTWTADGEPTCPIDHNTVDHNVPRCRVTHRWRQRRDLFNDTENWHQRPPIFDAHTVAYCAHCDIPYLTDRTL